MRAATVLRIVEHVRAREGQPPTRIRIHWIDVLELEYEFMEAKGLVTGTHRTERFNLLTVHGVQVFGTWDHVGPQKKEDV